MSAAASLRPLLFTPLLICVSLVALAGSRAHASPIVDSPTGLASPDEVVDFGNLLFPNGTPIDNQFASSGVTFGPNYSYYTTLLPQPPATVFGYLLPPTTNSPLGSIFFSTDVTAAGFSLRTRPRATSDL